MKAAQIKLKNINQFTENYVEVIMELGMILAPEDALNSFSAENEYYETLLIFTDEDKIVSLINMFKKYNILISAEDLTDKLIGNKLSIEEFYNLFQADQYEKIEEKIKETILANIDVDFVLDKINESGIESLTELELSVLK
jgi:hypothetical protein